MANPTTNFGWVMPTATDLVTDLPADFAVFGQGVDTSMAYLLGGTTGQILSKTSATNMAFTWINNDQGDITGITATSPLTGGGSSGAITVGIQDATTSVKGSVQLSDSTSTTSSVLAATPTAVKSAYDLANAAIPKTLTTTTGDVIYASAANTPARLGIGSTSQVLTVTGGLPVWATPAGGGGWTLINGGGTPLGSGTTSVSSIPGTYQQLRVWVVGFTPSAIDLVYRMQINGDTGGNYLTVASSNSTVNNVSFGGTSWQLNVNGISDDANTVYNFNEIVLSNYASTTAYKVGQSLNFYRAAAGGSTTNWGLYLNNVAWGSASAITSVGFSTNGTGFTAGTIYVYGVK